MALELACRMGMIEHMIRYEHWNSGATGIVIGLSGGVDSAVASCLMLPGRRTGKRSRPFYALISQQPGR